MSIEADNSSIEASPFINSILERCTIKEGKLLNDETLQEILDNSSVATLSRTGSTAIHYVISDARIVIENCAELIKELVMRGVDIDHQDKQGRTALHYAAIFGKKEGALGLLKNGADINITDAQGKTPFAISYKKSIFYTCDETNYEQDSCDEYDWEPFNDVFTMYAKHVHKLRYCDLYLNELNRELLNDGAIYKYLRCSKFDRFYEEIERTKLITVGSSSLRLYEFLFKLNSETLYMNMVRTERQEIEDFFENTDKHNLQELDCILQLRYKEIAQRLRLAERALDSLYILINKYELPYDYCQSILMYLTNADLKNLILSTSQ